MRLILLLTLVGGLMTPQVRAEVFVLGVEDRPNVVERTAVLSGRAVRIRVLLPAERRVEAIRARLFQRAGEVARPLPTTVAVRSDPADLRVAVVEFTPPAVERLSELVLRFGDRESISLMVFPDEATRKDRPSLAAVLKASGVALAVCGLSPELRAFLRDHALRFEDFGAEAPDRLEPDTLLVGVFNERDWRVLSDSAVRGSRLLGFVEEPGLLPGVYPNAAPRGGSAVRTKVTLALLRLLPADPRARQTFSSLLYESLGPDQR